MKTLINATVLALIPVGMLAISASTLAQVTAPQPPLATTPAEMVDTLTSVFGPHKERAIHAKGVLLEGVFTPAPTAASVSVAPHLQKKSVPIIVRFSNFAGIPDIPDNHPLASPRGMAIRFKLPDGSNTDMVTHSFNGFPSANADQFRELLQALAASGPDAAKPTQLDTYLGGHPIAKTFLTSAKPAPVSYGSLPYFGVNAFKFTNAAGKVAYGRYRIVPVAAPAYLTDDQTKAAAPGYLSDEISAHVAQTPVKFKLLLQIADKDDKVDDPSVAWPDSRRTVDLGTIAITKVAPELVAAQKAIVFMPNALPKGIAVEDEMVNFRSSAYAVSFARRH